MNKPGLIPSTFAFLAGAAALAAQTAPPPEPSADESILVLERFVSTATRSAVAIADVATRVDVVSTGDLAATPGFYVTDMLKKNASVDVIQYPSGQSGIGIRGYRPDLGGTNQRTLLLVDGRPAGATNFGHIPAAGIARIELLKGPASSLYGSQAMGGVVNLITRRSSGPISGSVSAGAGSHRTVVGDVSVGGIAGKFDFDLAAKTATQFVDYTMGNGEVRPSTRFNGHHGYARLGRGISEQWRVDASFSTFLTWGTELPGMYSDGEAGASSKNLSVFSGDIKIEGHLDKHHLQATIYATEEYHKNFRDDVPSYRDSIRTTAYSGLQLQDSWQAVDNAAGTFESLTVMYGADYQRVGTDNARYLSNGDRTASPANDRSSIYGGFVDLAGKMFSGRLVLNTGVRYDIIDASVRETAFTPDVIPGTSRLRTTNPRAGFVYAPSSRWRFHGTAGRGFVAPPASQIAGRSERVVTGQTQITYGNPNLNPESAWSYDFGVGYDSRILSTDATWFYTLVSDKIVSVITTNTPELRTGTYVNASTAVASGLELSWALDLGAAAGRKGGVWRLTGSYTRMFERHENLPTGRAVTRNVAKHKLNGGLYYAAGRFKANVNARYVQGFWDQDFSRLRIYTNGVGGIFEEESKVIWDLNTSVQIAERDAILLSVSNLFDRFYYEKGDYPMAGRMFIVRYRRDF